MDLTFYYRFLARINSRDALDSDKIIRSVGYIFDSSCVNIRGIGHMPYYSRMSTAKVNTCSIIRDRIGRFQEEANCLDILVKNACGKK